MSASPQGGSVDSEHTPGPWTASVFAGSFLYVAAPLDANSTEQIAVICDTHAGRRTTIANARLIAAAPDLLDALRTFVDRCVCKEATGLYCDECGAARAAIAKATDERREEASS